MDNPWSGFSKEKGDPYVLDCDYERIKEFNEQETRANYKLNISQCPEPWLGPVEKPALMVLQLNPRYKPDDPFDSNKLSVLGKLGEPHYGLSTSIAICPKTMKWKLGWWQDCFKQVAIIVGHSLSSDCAYSVQLSKGFQYMAKKVCSVELVPYGSINFDPKHLALHCPDFALELVRAAIKDEVHIVILKGDGHWGRAVRELKGYPHLTVARGPGNRGTRYITPYSCGQNFCKIVKSVCPTCTS